MLADIIPIDRTFTIAGRDWKVPLLGFLAFHAELEIYIFQEMSQRLSILAENASKEVIDRLYQLYVGGHSSRAWDTWGVTGVAQLIVKAGGVGLLWAPGVAAYPVMYSTVDVLKIQNVGSAAVNYDVIFVGTSQ